MIIIDEIYALVVKMEKGKGPWRS